MRGGSGAPVQLLRRARGAPPALRQADRRHRRRATGGARGHPAESTCERRDGCGAHPPGTCACAGTGVAVRRSPALALDGDRRQPSPDARLPGQRRARGRAARVEEPAGQGRGPSRRHRVARRGQRSDSCVAGGEQRRTAGAQRRAVSGGLPRRARAARALRATTTRWHSVRRSHDLSTRCPNQAAWGCT